MGSGTYSAQSARARRHMYAANMLDAAREQQPGSTLAARVVNDAIAADKDAVDSMREKHGHAFAPLVRGGRQKKTKNHRKRTHKSKSRKSRRKHKKTIGKHKKAKRKHKKTKRKQHR